MLHPVAHLFMQCFIWTFGLDAEFDSTCTYSALANKDGGDIHDDANFDEDNDIV